METQEHQKPLLLDSEEQQDEKRKKEAEEHKHETGDIKALIQEQKMQENTTAELDLLRGELNNEITRISEVEENVATIKDSTANIRDCLLYTSRCV